MAAPEPVRAMNPDRIKIFSGNANAALAEEIYRNDPQLTDFEAFGEEDLYGESTAAPEG